MSDSDFIRNVNSVQNGAFSTPEIAEITDLRAKLQAAEERTIKMCNAWSNRATNAEDEVQSLDTQVIILTNRAEAAEEDARTWKGLFDNMLLVEGKLRAEVARLTYAEHTYQRSHLRLLEIDGKLRIRIAALEAGLREIMECMGGNDPSSGWDCPEDVWGIAHALLGEEKP